MSVLDKFKAFESSWGNLAHKEDQGKKISEHQLNNETLVDGNWGHGIGNNLGLYGFRGTKEENKHVGKLLGGNHGTRKNGLWGIKA